MSHIAQHQVARLKHMAQVGFVAIFLFTTCVTSRAAQSAADPPSGYTVYLPMAQNPPALIPAPAQLSGAPIRAARPWDWDSWLLLPDGRIVDANGAVEPFPLDPALGIRDVYYAIGDSFEDEGTLPVGLVAATAHGIYRRDEPAFRWSKISDLVGSHLSTCFNNLWVVPDAHPDEIWQSQDDGATWITVSHGLRGDVVSSIQYGLASCMLLHVITSFDGQYHLWGRGSTDRPEPWGLVAPAPIPGAAIEHRPGGVPGSFFFTIANGGLDQVGSTDGNIYIPIYDNYTDEFVEWRSIYSFGAGKYPIRLNEYRLSVLDLATGEMQPYEISYNYEHLIWWPLPSLPASAPWGAKAITNSVWARHIYGSPDALMFAQVILGQDGGLYRYELGLGPGGDYGFDLITPTPQRTDFIPAQGSADWLHALYSGATLTWNGASCTANETGFYRSTDQGVTWTLIVSDTARHPITAPSPRTDGKTWILASTCAGPSLSADGGSTWQTPAALGWPLTTGAEHLTVRGAHYGDDFPWDALYAAGVRPNGQAFVFRAGYDETAHALGPWVDITPPDAAQPLALGIGNDDETRHEVYVADENTVWLSVDDGATWHSRSAGLDGAKVLALHPYSNYSSDPYDGILAATDQGVMFGQPPEYDSPWIRSAFTYTNQPTDMLRLVGPSHIVLNSAEGAFDLMGEYFYYIPPPTPTVACTQLITNSSFEVNGGWLLPATAYTAGYSVDQIYAGKRSLRTGIPVSGPNRYSYSTGYQYFDLPANAISITLKARVWRGGTDAAGDLQYLWVTSVGGMSAGFEQVSQEQIWRDTFNDIDAGLNAPERLWHIRQAESELGASTRVVFQSLANSQQWDRITYDLTPLRGQRVRLLFGALNDGTEGKAVMYADSVVVESCR